jgi:hypothetical protein
VFASQPTNRITATTNKAQFFKMDTNRRISMVIYLLKMKLTVNFFTPPFLRFQIDKAAREKTETAK